MWTRALSVPICLIVLLTVGGGYAVAEDVPADGTGMTAPDVQPVEGETDGEALEGEIGEAPAYEEPYEESMQERYYRITRDFIKPQAIGLGRLGRIPVYPRGIIKAGPFRFSPFLNTEIGWQSNVNLEEDAEDSSWFWSARVGVTADAEFLKDRLKLLTTAEILYRDYTRGSVNDDWEGILGASMRYDIPVGIWVHLGATYTHLFDPVDEEDIPTRLERDGWDFFFDLGFDEILRRTLGGRFKVEVGMDVKNRNFAEHEFSLGDRMEAEAHLRVSYALKTELDVFIEGGYGYIIKSNTRLNDNDYVYLIGGLDGTYGFGSGQRIQGQIFAGVQRDQFDEQKELSIGSDRLHTDQGEDKTDLKAGAQIRYLMGTKTQFTVLYIRTTAFSLEGDFQTVDRIDLAANHLIIRGLMGRIAVFGEWNRPSNVDDTYEYGGGVGVRYTINDFLDADLNYDLRIRQDTEPVGNDYEDHRVVLGLTFYLR